MSNRVCTSVLDTGRPESLHFYIDNQREKENTEEVKTRVSFYVIALKQYSKLGHSQMRA